MARILYLVHRFPYPPNKGDKVRSFHLLKHLSAKHEVYLGTFVDDPDDEQHVPFVRAMVAELLAVPLRSGFAKVRSLIGLLKGQAMSLPYFGDRRMRLWVEKTCAERGVDAVVVFSSPMAQYTTLDPSAHPAAVRGTRLVDFVDVDSEKWAQYARQHRWPMSWIYAREARLLLKYEREIARAADQSFFVSDREVELFRRRAPECRDRIAAIGNGVDTEYFSPDPQRPNPFGADELPIVFSGTMDHWPNIDAVCWFAADVLKVLKVSYPKVKFFVVGRNPSAAVRSLASDNVVVVGAVADVRPYLQHAAVVVAPMRLARGVQNKILEGMAMSRPVVAAMECVSAVQAQPREGLIPASTSAEYVAAVKSLLANPTVAGDIGRQGRACVVRAYNWSARLSALDRYLPRPESVARSGVVEGMK
jgi:polysaccharide biosynthesis protein PslH